jgi:homoserine O-acetyltransferase
MGLLADLAEPATGAADACDETDCPTAKSSLYVGYDILAPIPSNWRAVHGAALEDGAVRARLVGRRDGPVVAVLGGISADRFVALDPTLDGPRRKGWWWNVACEGGGVDLSRYRVLGLDFSPLQCEAPLAITPADQAQLVALAMDAAGVPRLHTFVGASYGGMVALSFARQFPERVDRLAVISAAHRPHPMATAWRGVQRRILQLAVDVGRPEDGVALARQLAMTTYRTPEEFAERFTPGIADAGDDGEVCGYLKARGEAYAALMSPARLTTLSAAIDRHTEEPEAITAPTLLIAADSDRLVPITDMRELAGRLAGPAELKVVSTLYGHDSFLKDAAEHASHLRAWLDAPETKGARDAAAL